MIRFFRMVDGSLILADEQLQEDSKSLFYLVHNAVEIYSLVDTERGEQKYVAKGLRNPFATTFPIVTHLQVFNVAEYYQDVDEVTEAQYHNYVERYTELPDDEDIDLKTDKRSEEITNTILKHWNPANTNFH
tara:strand:- start:487 stop:882 length:396 start_codon:yes stop_codon:yes gene_type:complete